MVLLILLGIAYNGGLAFRPLEVTRVCSVLAVVAYIFTWWLVLWFLHRKRIYLRV